MNDPVSITVTALIVAAVIIVPLAWLSYVVLPSPATPAAAGAHLALDCVIEWVESRAKIHREAGRNGRAREAEEIAEGLRKWTQGNCSTS